MSGSLPPVEGVNVLGMRIEAGMGYLKWKCGIDSNRRISSLIKTRIITSKKGDSPDDIQQNMSHEE